MKDITAEVLTSMTQKKQRLLALMKIQDEQTLELVQLEKRYDVGAVSQAELERRLPELTRRQGKQQHAIATVLAEIELLRQDIFHQTGMLLPPIP